MPDLEITLLHYVNKLTLFYSDIGNSKYSKGTDTQSHVLLKWQVHCKKPKSREHYLATKNESISFKEILKKKNYLLFSRDVRLSEFNWCIKPSLSVGSIDSTIIKGKKKKKRKKVCFKKIQAPKAWVLGEAGGDWKGGQVTQKGLKVHCSMTVNNLEVFNTSFFLLTALQVNSALS